MLRGICRYSILAAVVFSLATRGGQSQQQDTGADVRQHFEAGRQAQTSGDYDTAIREYKAVVVAQPLLAEAYANLGIVYQMAARPDESAQALQKAVTLKPELRGVRLFLGIDYVKIHQPARAIPLLKIAAQQEPQNKEAASWLGTALWDAGQTTAALTQLSKAVQTFPGDCDVLFLLGEAYQKTADQDVEQALNQSLGKPLYHQIYGDIYREQHVWDKAEGHYRRALQIDPRWQGAHLGLGEIDVQVEKWLDAKREFEAEKELALPSAAAALAKLSELAVLEGQPEEAIRTLTAAVQISPERASDALGLPPVPFSSEADPAPAAAQERYRQFLSAQDRLPDGPARHLALAYVNAKAGANEKSLDEWKLFVHVIPDALPAARLQRAGSLFARHDFDAASENLQSVLASAPQDLTSRYLLARAYRNLAMLVLARMLVIDPNFYRAHELLAKTYEQRDENDKALAEYKTVAQMRPELSGVHFAMGHLLWTMQDSDAALLELKQELRLNPGHPEANAEIGTILVNKHQAGDAIPYLRRALALKPDLSTARQQLGMAFYQLNDFSGAERELKRAVSDDPEGSAHFLLGMVYRKMGRAQESTVALNESRRIRSERLAGINVEKEEPAP